LQPSGCDESQPQNCDLMLGMAGFPMPMAAVPPAAPQAMPQQQQSPPQQVKHSNLFVGNLAADTTEEKLKAIFTPFGTVESCLVVNKPDKTHGFVKMAEISAAEAAMANLDNASGLVVKMANYDVGGRRKGGGKGGWGGYGGGWGKGGYMAYANWAWYGNWWPSSKLPPRDDEKEKERPEPAVSDNLYVKHLPVGISEEDLTATFTKVGEVTSLRIIKPEFALEWSALVRLATEQQAQTARTSLDEQYPQAVTPPLEAHTQQKGGSTVDDHVYIKHLPTNTTTEKIDALCSRFGEVKWSSVLPPSTRQWRVDSSRAALVQMGSTEEAAKVIEAFDGKPLPLSDVGATMKVRYAESKVRAQPTPA